jgi:dimethylglycine dehydrogenase
VSYGMEYPLFFGPTGLIEQPSLRRSNAFPFVATECRAVRQSVGILDISSFARYEVRGAGAVAALERVFASQLPAVGRIRLAPLLTPRGRLMGDLTILRLATDRFIVTGSGYMQRIHMRWFEQHLAGAEVNVTNVSETLSGIALVGPRARVLLGRLADMAVDNDAFPFMSVRETTVGLAPTILGRISVTGELGYELHVPAAHLGPLYSAVVEAAKDLDARDLGMYALNSLRLEKGYGIWSREFSQDYTPAQSGLSRFVAYDRPGFIGREAALAERSHAPVRQLVLLEVDATDADASGFEPIWAGEQMVGFTTSGGFGHCAESSLAMGYVSASSAAADTALEISVVDERRHCRVLSAPPIDPAGLRLRS